MFKTPSHAMVARRWNYSIHPLNKGLVPFATLGLRSMRMHYFGHAARINTWLANRHYPFSPRAVDTGPRHRPM
ncbi:MAG: hypothetical protein R2818_12730 [Flavobacteriales bacterium]